MNPRDHLPLTIPVFHILLTLMHEDSHGYSIIQNIRERTSGEVSLTASTLYAAIRRLRESGMISELTDRPEDDPDPRRRYYRITPFGRDVLRLEAERLERQLALARETKLMPTTGRSR